MTPAGGVQRVQANSTAVSASDSTQTVLCVLKCQRNPISFLRAFAASFLSSSESVPTSDTVTLRSLCAPDFSAPSPCLFSSDLAPFSPPSADSDPLLLESEESEESEELEELEDSSFLALRSASPSALQSGEAVSTQTFSPGKSFNP